MSYPRAIVLAAMIAIACSLKIPQASVAKIGETPDTIIETGMVVLHVRVTDSKGTPIADVPQDDFVITEDGVPQKITLFTKDSVPLTYGLVIDSSASLRTQYLNVIRAAETIVESNRPADETFLVRFISSDKIETTQETTSDKALLMKVLRDDFYLEHGQSAVIDAVYLSAEKLGKQTIEGASVRRQALILITDGEERNSYYDSETLFKLLAATDVQIFTIGLTKELKPGARDKAVKFLTRLGTYTGGQTFFPASPADIELISKQIIDVIRRQYVIGYMPTGIDARKDFHKIQVSITDNPNQEKRVAVTRIGYSTRSAKSKEQKSK